MLSNSSTSQLRLRNAGDESNSSPSPYKRQAEIIRSTELQDDVNINMQPAGIFDRNRLFVKQTGRIGGGFNAKKDFIPKSK